jgi:hypothetical protein
MNINAIHAVARLRFSLTSEENLQSELFSLAAVAAFIAAMSYVIARAV